MEQRPELQSISPAAPAPQSAVPVVPHTPAYAGRRDSRLGRWIYAGLALLVVTTVGFAGWWMTRPGTSGRAATFVSAVRGDLIISLTEKGEIQAVNNVDIDVPVRGRNTIVEIIDEGTFVKEGDVLARLDDTEWRKAIQESEVEVRGSEGDVVWAEEQLTLTQNETAGKIDEAEVALKTAHLTLEKFENGERPQALRKADRAVEVAKLKFEKAVEQLNQKKALYTKDFATIAEVQDAQQELITAGGAVEDAESEREVLIKYKHKMQSDELRYKLDQAKRALARAKTEAESDVTQKKSDLHAKKARLRAHRERHDFNLKQVEACVVKAPSPGMVLYSTSVQESWRYSGNGPLAVGSEVRSGQLLFRLPDTSAMQASVKINEHRISDILATAKAPADDATAEAVPGTPAVVTITGYASPVTGTVSSKGIMPSQDNYWGGDKKTYPVKIALDAITGQDVKPGATCTVELRLDVLRDVVMIPNACVYREGEQAWVFLRRPEVVGGPLAKQVEARKIVAGRSSDTQVEIIDGLAGGEEVLSLEVGQGATLLDGVLPDRNADSADKTASQAVAAQSTEAVQSTNHAEEAETTADATQDAIAG